MLTPFWKPDNKAELVVETTGKTFLRGSHRGEPIWKVSKGEEYLLIRQAEAMEWNKYISVPQPTESVRKDPLSN